MRRRLSTALCVALAIAVVILCPAPAEAQVANVLNRVPADMADGPSADVSFTGEWRSGNIDLIKLQAQMTLRYRYGRHLWMLSAQSNFAVRSGDRFINNDLQHIRYRVTIVGPFELEAFGQHDRNEFRRRELRGLLGIGPRIVALTGEPMSLALGLAYMPEYEALSEGEFTDSGLARWRHRLSSYMSIATKVFERIELGLTVFGQPAVEDFLNVRFLSQLSAAVRIVGPLKFGLSYTLQFDTEPPDTVRPADANRRILVTASF